MNANCSRLVVASKQLQGKSYIEEEEKERKEGKQREAKENNSVLENANASNHDRHVMT
jgi:hypothetical protein